ncbi:MULTISPECIES: hypothetical protein [Streptomyces]|uniref:Uncharacterized protein n=1 Tax=Streptomyces canarius TaxID=285453 RepID=A0ABQ3D7S0_9ACTN|nr:hypothetical protein [Streptomyces canarius]GHA63689.1 hypothetical protein GCM10010345_79830 [Streptomyces canarius]
MTRTNGGRKGYEPRTPSAQDEKQRGELEVPVAADGEVVDVPVTVGLSAAGQVEVGLADVPLGAGDQVVAG